MNSADPAWDRLGHAYGSAEDTPRHLRNLLSADATDREAALIHLWGSVLHQGSLYTSTAPAATAVAQMLADARDREILLSFLGSVAGHAASHQADPRIVYCLRRDDAELAAFEVVWEPEDDPDHVVVGGFASAFVARAGVILPLLVPWLDSPDPGERRAALYATAGWTALAAENVTVPDRALRHLRDVALDTSAEAGARIECVLGLAGAGADTAELLDSESELIRTCAALSPAVTMDPRTLPIIAAALTPEARCDEGIREQPPMPYIGDGLISRLVEAALRRCAHEFPPLVLTPSKVAAAIFPRPFADTWGPLLRAAFSPQQSLDEPQRACLLALAALDDLWQEEETSRDELLTQLGLPADRHRLRAWSNGYFVEGPGQPRTDWRT